MRSCTDNACRGGLRVLLLLLGLAALFPAPAPASIQPFARQEPLGVTAAWGTDLDEAIGRARTDLRPILVFFTAPNCPACNQMRLFSFKKTALQSLIKKFERVEIDLSKRPELVTLFKIETIPALYIIAPDGRIQGRRQGYASASALKQYLEKTLAGHWSALELDRLISALASGRATAGQWRQALSAMQNTEFRDRMQALAGGFSPGDIKNLTACLGAGQLAVRLGALDLLEQVNDTITGLDPWADPGDNDQKAALRRWRSWAAGGQKPAARAVALTQDEFDRYIQDLIGPDTQRARRALRGLLRGGPRAAHFIQDYFQSHPTLDADTLRRIKEIQYALVIAPSSGLDPLATAHRIVWGNQDVQMRTIRQLADGGLGPSAILVDLLAHDNPLVRETAVEILFKAAGPLAVAPVKKMLEREKDPDICFAVLKQLGDTNTVEGRQILQSYFTNDNEDLVIAAIDGLVKSSVRSLGATLLPLLADPRWRVRVAAIEGIKKKGGSDAGLFDRMRGKQMRVPGRIAKALCRCLEDPDEFVRHTAAAALGELKIDGAEGPLKDAYDRHPDMHGVVVRALMSLDKSIPSSMVDDLFGPVPDDLLFVLDRIDELNNSSRKLIHKAAASENADIACSALRIIAGTEKRRDADNALLISALQSGKTEKQLTVIQEFDLDSDDLKSVRSALSGKLDKRQPGNSHVDVLLAAARLMADPSASELVRNNALMLLYKHGYPGAFAKVSATYTQLTAAMRTVVADSLAQHGREAIALFKLALDDNYTDVWQAALNQLSDAEGRKLFAEPLRDYLLASPGRLTPAMMWPEGLHSLCTEDPRLLHAFAGTILSAPDTASPDRLILALTVYALTGMPQDDQPSVLALTKDGNPFVRRAAWLALLTGDETALEKHFDAVLADPSRRVRELIPTVLFNSGYDKVQVELYFSEEEYFSGYQGLRLDPVRQSAQAADSSAEYGYERRRTIRPAVAGKIKSIIADEPDPMIRFRCMLCLLSYKIPLDLGQVYATARSAGNPGLVADLLGDFFSTHGYELGQSFKILLPLLQTPDGHGGSEYLIDMFTKRWGGAEQPSDQTRLSFIPARNDSPSTPLTATFTNGYSDIRGEDRPAVQIALFTTAGCRRCFAVEKIIQFLKFQFGNLRVRRHDILTRQGLVYNEALSRKFMLEDSYHATAPAVFAAGGYLTDRDITFFSMQKLAGLSMAETAGNGPLSVTPEELAAADDFIRQRRNAFSWFGIARSGISKGLNPLVLAALLLTMYYLNSAGRAGLSIMRYGLLYMVTAAAVTIALWLLPQADMAQGVFIHNISGALMWLMLIGIVVNALRSLLHPLRRLKKKAKNTIKKQKSKKIPGRRYVAGVVVSWAVVLVVLDLLALGNSQTVTLVYSIKNHVSAFSSLLLLILFCVMAMLPSAGILWAFVQVSGNAGIRSFIDAHQIPAKITLSAVWIWMAVKYFQVI